VNVCVCARVCVCVRLCIQSMKSNIGILPGIAVAGRTPDGSGSCTALAVFGAPEHTRTKLLMYQQ